jgi:hypothetical protein
VLVVAGLLAIGAISMVVRSRRKTN